MSVADEPLVYETANTDGTIDKVTVYPDDAGEWRWRRTAANNKKVSDSGEGYSRKDSALRAAHRLNPPVESEVS